MKFDKLDIVLVIVTLAVAYAYVKGSASLADLLGVVGITAAKKIPANLE